MFFTSLYILSHSRSNEWTLHLQLHTLAVYFKVMSCLSYNSNDFQFQCPSAAGEDSKMFCTLLKLIVKAIIYSTIVLTLIAVVPGIPPDLSFEVFDITPPRELKGPLALNGILDEATKVVDGQITGAESIAIINGILYTGVRDGRVVRIEETAKGPKISTVVQLGKPCAAQMFVDCSRPLGIRADASGQLIVADAAQGIFKINPTTGKTDHLVDIKTPIDGLTPGLPNDLAVAKDGTIYWSDLLQVPKNTPLVFNLADISGRLIKYDPKTKKNTVLVKNLAMANGVALSDDEEYVIVNECSRGRTIRYYLKGSKASTQDVFVDGLPGVPDNTRSNGKGGHYITLFGPLNPFLVSTGKYPLLRKLSCRLQWIILTALKSLDSFKLVNEEYLGQLIAVVELFGPSGMRPEPPIVVELDKDGNIIHSLHVQHRRGEIVQGTQFTLGDKYAYMGSYSEGQIWKIPRSALP